MMNKREQAGQIVDRCWDEAEEYAETGYYCPGRIDVFKWAIKVELHQLISEVSRLREIAGCNDPGAVGSY